MTSVGHSRLLRTLAATQVLVALSSCSGDGSTPLVESSTAPGEVCGDSRPDELGWVDSSGKYQQQGVFGTTESSWVGDPAGVAVSGHVFVYDYSTGRVFRLSPSLSAVQDTFGRPGEGPGELATNLSVLRTTNLSTNWIASAKSGLVVFDGRAVSRFRSDGTFEGKWLQDAYSSGLTPHTHRIVADRSDVLYFDAGGYGQLDRSSTRGSPEFQVRRLSDGSNEAQVVFRLALSPLPANARGVPFQGPDQALPLWAMGNGCLVITDGSDSQLFRVSTSSTLTDTLTFDWEVDFETESLSDAELLMKQLGGSGELPDPSAVKHVEDVIVDPDNIAWLLLKGSSSEDDRHIIKFLDLVEGEVWLDTLEFFPAAFGPRGVLYAEGESEMGESLILRYVKRG